MEKIIYLKNVDMLEEIFLSKISFCEFVDPKYKRYDHIINLNSDLMSIFDENIINMALAKRADRLSKEMFNAALDEFHQGIRAVKPKKSEFVFEQDSLTPYDLIFRVYTYEHIPEDLTRKKTPKKTADLHARLNFIPFKHYRIVDLENKKLEEVGRSHYKNGEFCLTHGSITNRLATMFILLVERYAQKTNWRGYSYLEEMQGQALIQLTAMGLRFDEDSSDNPFAYYTSFVTNSFTKVLNEEKDHQNLRDDLLQHSGLNPSFSRQLEHEEHVRTSRETLSDDF